MAKQSTTKSERRKRRTKRRAQRERTLSRVNAQIAAWIATAVPDRYRLRADADDEERGRYMNLYG